MPDLRNFNTFSGNTLDRAGNIRKSTEWMASQIKHPKAKFLPILNLTAPIQTKNNSKNIKYLNLNQMTNYKISYNNLIFLGIKDETPYFAFDISKSKTENEKFFDNVIFEEVRKAAMYLSNEDSSLLAHARSMVDWKLNNNFCPKCGYKTKSHQGGHIEICGNKDCNKEIFPRTDPVVIMLVYNKNNCVVGRQSNFPVNFFSVLAGFIEPGESIESAVYREVFEEIAIKVKNIVYHSSQPWPYPSSLMIGCIAEAENTNIVIDEEEIVEAKWVNRELILSALKKSKASKEDPLTKRPDNTLGELLLPPPIAIAHHLLKYWAENPRFFL
ncbi:MAG: NAD(+) diphosphatase [Rhodospirillaceae bacterium]|nr:NAD(+) diphosphatase [Rhodospirillaceae bacterium]|tara:strand:- start:65 stop:1048 length:984 start_codon:yes stop_codon:yes gene_type:complete